MAAREVKIDIRGESVTLTSNRTAFWKGMLMVADLHWGKAQSFQASGIASPSMTELGERISRARTAVQSWLDVDDTLERDEYPDAQLLRDRMRLASRRWPRRDELPGRVEALAKRVEDYYESGENPRERVL